MGMAMGVMLRLLLGQAVLLLILAALAALAAGLPPAAEAQPARPTLTGKRFSSVAGNSNTPEGGTESSGWYFYNDLIEAELTFSEAVTVQGNPYLKADHRPQNPDGGLPRRLRQRQAGFPIPGTSQRL